MQHTTTTAHAPSEWQGREWLGAEARGERASGRAPEQALTSVRQFGAADSHSQAFASAVW